MIVILHQLDYPGFVQKDSMNCRSTPTLPQILGVTFLFTLFCSMTSNSHKMDDAIEPRTTRASKRRRLSQAHFSPKLSCSPSPDELASGTPTPPVVSRNGSTPSFVPQNEPARPSYSPVSEALLDEIDHTAEQHTFFRNDEPYRGSINGKSHLSSGTSERRLRPPSPKTPEYSRISTPIASPLPERMTKEARFPGYRCKQVLHGHKKGVAAIRCSPRGRTVATCCKPSLFFYDGAFSRLTCPSRRS